MTKPLRILVLNVDVGAGHRLAAAGLREALEELRPGSRFETVEALDYLGPDARRITQDLYLGVQRSAPRLWGVLYEQRSLLQLLRPLGELVDGWRAEELLPRALRFNPQLVIATHPVGCGLGAGLRRGREITAPLVAVVTDFDGHPAWVVKGVDLYLAATPEVAGQLERSGAPAGSVAATGIPLRRAFGALPPPAEAARCPRRRRPGRASASTAAGSPCCCWAAAWGWARCCRRRRRWPPWRGRCSWC
jgi:processive 1,2-diacylglycerol beta-glucosyltransferase